MEKEDEKRQNTDRKMRGFFLSLNLIGLVTAVIGEVMSSNPAVAAGLGMAIASAAALSFFL